MTAAGRLSGRRIWKIISTCVRSARSIFASTRAPGWRSSSMTAQYEIFDGDLVSTDPLKFVDLKAYSHAPAPGAERHRPERRGDQRAGQTDRAHRDGKRDGVRIHRRQHGRGGGRDHHPRGGTRRRHAHPADYCFGVGRGAHDGGRGQPDATGENFSRRWRGWTKQKFLTFRC